VWPANVKLATTVDEPSHLHDHEVWLGDTVGDDACTEDSWLADCNWDAMTERVAEVLRI
jgi:hypothetical protein